MEVVNVKNVIIKYIPEHIVVETYVLSNNSQSTEATLQSNAKNKLRHDPGTSNELDDLFYISMDESLNPDSDDENKFEVDNSMKEFTEEEYLEVDDEIGEMFIENDEDIENLELVDIESQTPNQFHQTGSIQLLRDWFFSHLNVNIFIFHILFFICI